MHKSFITISTALVILSAGLFVPSYRKPEARSARPRNTAKRARPDCKAEMPTAASRLGRLKGSYTAECHAISLEGSYHIASSKESL